MDTLFCTAGCGSGSATGRGQGGFTLTELLTVVAVIAITMTVAVPGLSNLLNGDRLTTTTNELIGSIQQAQLEAVKRNNPAQFCSNSSTNNNTDTLGNACGSTLGAVFWINTNSTAKSQPTTEIQGVVQIPPNISIGDGTNGTTAVTALRFTGNGLATIATATNTTPYTGFVADIYTSKLSSNNHRCIYITTGSSVSSCTYNAACPTNEPTTCQEQQ